uniref:Uncharacterized protein n=1 Tax=Glossina pallidipes TaxID=7398 RepID=A0A1A9ZJC7_GLOPL
MQTVGTPDVKAAVLVVMKRVVKDRHRKGSLMSFNYSTLRKKKSVNEIKSVCKVISHSSSSKGIFSINAIKVFPSFLNRQIASVLILMTTGIHLNYFETTKEKPNNAATHSRSSKMIAFLTGVLDMTLLQKLDFPEAKFSLYFMGLVLNNRNF